MAQRAAVKTTYEIARTIQPIYAGGSAALSADGRILAACLGEDALLTDLTTGATLARIEGDGEAITSLALTPSASHLITGEDGLRVELSRTLRPHTSPVVTLAVDRTGTLIWDIEAGYFTHIFHGHSGVVSALHFFQVNGKKRKRRRSQVEQDYEDTTDGASILEYRLASGAEDGKIRIWDLHKRKSAAVLDSHVSAHMLLSGSRDKTLIMWDARTWKVKRTIAALEGIERVGYICDGHIAYSGGEDGRIRLWSTASATELTKEQQPGLETDAIVDILHHASLPYLVSVHADQVLNFHSMSPVALPFVEETIDPLPIFRRVSGTHDESLLALNTNSEDVRIITLDEANTSTAEGKYFGADVALLKGHDDIIICLDVDWSGHWLATGAKDNTARLWRLDPQTDSYTCHAVLTGHAESLGAIALPHSAPPPNTPAFTDPLSHPPPYLVTGSQDRTIKRWDISASTPSKTRAKYTRKAHDKDINALDIDPTSTLFASASQDRTVKIYSATEGEAIGVLRGHRRGVWTVKFCPQASQPSGSSKLTIATGSGDKTVKIWSLSDYSCLLTLEGHSNSILKLAWLPHAPLDARDKRGAQIASAAGDGLVKVWDTSTGELQATLDNHTDRVWALTAHPQTGALISGAADSVITFWANTTSATLEAAVSAATARVEKEQQLHNYAQRGNYRDAVTLALAMDQPARLFALFKAVVETEVPEAGSLTGLQAVDEVLGQLADEQLYKLLVRLRDWNTNVRTAPVAQKVLNAVVRSYPASRLAAVKPGGKVGAKGGLKDVLDAIRAYSERHYKRVEELVDESYLLDFTLKEMDDVAGVGEITNGTARLGMGRERQRQREADVIMIE
ncbi:WD40 repeat-like protein [Lophiostoma macrostomum CBS 122681]|uniref:WD40 repeat-like protein n=1 Tax=Lophiostoma macrostomum CBS 122681 TaxID=1314788 RepID=A0A6A6SPN9_9PLEO|nr:WD40 repeat-like protein [Lophiostoma macrostomum CBS 122681]